MKTKPAPHLQILQSVKASDARLRSTELSRYAGFRAEVTSSLAEVLKTKLFDDNRIHHLLNGGASIALREQVSRETRSKYGMFFSSQSLASAVADLIQHRIIKGAVLADPACGAGDLLLACLARAPLHADLQSTIAAWSKRTFGLDIHDELAGATRERLTLLAATRLCRDGQLRTDQVPDLAESFSHIRSGDYFAQQVMAANADCVVMNPPFIEIDAPEGCGWATGKVQQAAIFTAAVVDAAKTGQEIVAVLPDVLRSGSRYNRWRDSIAKSADILDIKIFGRFDSKTDVDVFILHLRKRNACQEVQPFQWRAFTSQHNERQAAHALSDLFDISVGAVVPHRLKNKGPWALFVDVSSATANCEVRTLTRKLRFNGTLHKGPFVTLRRTSSPSDTKRAVGTLINATDYIAVENHLIVLQPRDRTLKSCRHLMDLLRQPQVDEWLNANIRCRHLTTKVVSELPLQGWL